MSIVQFWRIVWAWRWFIVATTVSCLAGAFVVTAILPPRWEAEARIVLNVLKPDPVSGMIVSGNATGAYISSQVSLITDYSVASRAVENMGWLSDPGLIARYDARGANDTRDFRHWAADLIITSIQAKVVPGSNILEISYTGPTPEGARAIAEAVRKAYIDTNLSLRRSTANRSADLLDVEVIKAKAALDAAEAAKYSYERENNVYMANETTDVDTAKLAAMAATAGSGGGAGGISPRVELAEVDSQIATLSQTLGPNHPQLAALRAKRAALSAAVASEVGTNSAARSGSAFDQQAAVVMSKSSKLTRLKQLQAELDVRRDIYNTALAQAAKQRQESAAEDTGMFSPLGPATVPASPSFPKMGLIIPGSLALGLVLGMLVSLLIELINRRVRGPEDLQGALDVPLLAVISVPK